MPTPADTLAAIKNFDDLVAYLEEELGWPLEGYALDDLTFEYSPAELGLKDEDAAKVREIRQLRPVVHEQPWGIFFVEFEKKRMPVVVLRRILSHLVLKKRASANPATAKAWNLGDLLFISAYGDERTDQREIAFAHFHQEAGDLPTLKVLGWDGADTGLKLDHVDSVLRERLCWPADPADVAAWRADWAQAFRHKLGHVIRTSDALAERLAVLARGIRSAALTLMNHESERGALRQLHHAFQTALIHDLTERDFADTYAQTVTYGLLTAAISSTDMEAGRYGTAVHAGKLADMVPITNPFLKEMLGTFLQAGGQKGAINFDELGVQEVVELLRGDETDLPAILRDFGNKTQGEDPVIFFYEHFLSAYDKQLKVQRGSFYTPRPVVSYIVRSVHELLQTEFGLKDGLASTVTWGEMAQRTPGLTIPEGAKADGPFVVILDPATGTGTFLVEVIEVIHRTLVAKWQAQGLGETQRLQAWNEYVPQHLLPRLHGYELMMAPYAIAHMKIGLKLWETGYRFGGSVERVRVYLTNSLEPPAENGGQLAFAGWTPALAHEAQAVNAIKRWQRFTVVIGNPPYSGVSANNSDYAVRLVDAYKIVDGEALNERKLWLQDDYVKFLRASQLVLASAHCGVLGLITNHGFLDNPTFRGMRQSLGESFTGIRILDLHGNANKGERGPDGGGDQNVFEIKQGVCITLAVSSPVKSPLIVEQSDLWGEREAKYQWLWHHSIRSTPWAPLVISSPYRFFVPRSESASAEYNDAYPLADVVLDRTVGMISARDALTIHYTADELVKTIRKFASLPTEVARLEFDLRSDVRDWSVDRAQADLLDHDLSEEYFRPILYRPFDIRVTFYTGRSRGFIGQPQSRIMSHLKGTTNWALCVSRFNRQKSTGYFFVTRTLTDFHLLDTVADSMTVFPLLVYPDQTSQSQLFSSQEPRANLRPDFVRILAERMGLMPPRSSGLPQGISESQIFQYIYALFHCPSYRSRYAEFLKIDFPRIPLTGDLALFRVLAALGEQLVSLHLMESPVLDAEKDALSTYSGPTGPVVEKVAYDDETIYLDKAGRASFCCISEAVWNFHIGGYQVCEKWLKDRKGRRLSPEDIEHYQKIIVALHHTIRIMDEIDEVIEEHGGWPIK